MANLADINCGSASHCLSLQHILIAVDLSMGVEMEFNNEKKGTVDLSPNTVLPSPRHRLNIEKRYSRGNLKHKDDILSIKDGFTEISFRRYRSSSCKNTTSRSVRREENVELKRGSIYQSSREVTKMKKTGSDEAREKIELSCTSDTSYSFTIHDSLCSLDEENQQNRIPGTSVNSSLTPTSIGKPYVEPCLSNGFIEICLNSDKREKLSGEPLEKFLLKDLVFNSNEVIGPQNDGNGLHERDTVLRLQKSHSDKVEMPYFPSPSDSDCSSRTSSKTRFSPIRKMFDPFMKSKSLRSPLGYVAELDGVNMRTKRTIRKSLLHDFSPSRQNSVFNSQRINKDQHHSVVECSPIHLHGCLKLINKLEVPFFEFSLNSAEEVLVGRIWKADNAFNWVYTFQSIGSKNKTNASGWGSSDINKESSMVGQMQVSCYLCSELKSGVLYNSMVTEFVLYDIAHARQSISSKECSDCSPDLHKSPPDSDPGLVGGTPELKDGPDAAKPKQHLKHAADHIAFKPSKKQNPYPWASADLHPNLEIAATVIQVPFEKRESLKHKRGDKVIDIVHSNLLKLPIVEPRKKNLPDNLCEKVKVVIPTGNHGLPTAENRAPSTLLDRWRLGGCCDCGGWDMGCPLVVFGNPSIPCAEDEPLVANQQPLELFLKGTKENTPAFTMSIIEEGQYAVDFHAQLSTLQAFSICVAILHGKEASTAGQERGIQLKQCTSLKELIEEEVKFLIEAVTEEGKKVNKKTEEIPRSYVINPPFSPISRV
ncbi:DUF3527 domain-containing protein [Cephalotus follicularis]|uniref:DUF3527 domain-containing protein n=1 Tax=Cephalotus follicularis TaxID=3775 RepID=A0A1Q3AQL6_CEPFO|nr:DUF3527 domain-containing protein [Cephalotus follicularis]